MLKDHPVRCFCRPISTINTVGAPNTVRQPLYFLYPRLFRGASTQIQEHSIRNTTRAKIQTLSPSSRSDFSERRKLKGVSTSTETKVVLTKNPVREKEQVPLSTFRPNFLANKKTSGLKPENLGPSNEERRIALFESSSNLLERRRAKSEKSGSASEKIDTQATEKDQFSAGHFSVDAVHFKKGTPSSSLSQKPHSWGSLVRKHVSTFIKPRKLKFKFKFGKSRATIIRSTQIDPSGRQSLERKYGPVRRKAYDLELEEWQNTRLIGEQWKELAENTIRKKRKRNLTDLSNNEGIDLAEHRRQEEIAETDFWSSVGSLQAEAVSSSINLSSKGVKYLESRSRMLSAHLHRKNVRTGLFKVKGELAYDWRVPFLLLRKAIRVDQAGKGQNMQETKERAGESLASSLAPVEAPSNNAESEGDDTEKYSQAPSTGMSLEQADFLSEVVQLTDATMNKNMKLLNNGGGKAATRSPSKEVTKIQVRDELFSLFRDDRNQSALTRDAFHVALRYLCGRNLKSDARMLLKLMEELGVMPDTTSYNYLLKATDMQTDLANYTIILKYMTESGLKPNAMTWVSFVSCITSHAARMRVVAEMKHLGFCEDKHTAELLAIQLLDVLVLNHIESKQPFSALIDRLDSMLGPHWFHLHSSTKLGHGLANAGQISQVVSLLETMAERGIQPGWEVLNLCLRVCALAKQPQLAFKFLRLLGSRWNIVPRRPSDFGYLFALGWSTSHYNICRLVWTVAAAKNRLGENMKSQVLKSLLRNTARDADRRRREWLRDAGKVIVGKGFLDETAAAAGAEEEASGSARCRERYHEIPDREGTVLLLDRWLPAGEERNAAYHVARQLFDEDATAWCRFRYEGDFVDDFGTALAMDEEWHANKWHLDYTKDLGWKLANAYRPKFVRLPRGKAGSGISEAEFERARGFVAVLEKQSQSQSESGLENRTESVSVTATV